MTQRVVDAFLLMALGVGGTRGDVVADLVASWTDASDTLLAPSLLRYEIASGFTRLVATGDFPQKELAKAMADIEALEIELHEPPDLVRVVEIARQLRRHSAYDAAYLDLATRLGATMWTLDKKLARNARNISFDIFLVE